MHNVILAAEEFARYAHRNQKRKYTEEPYFVHCEEVANIVRPFASTNMIVAALLHDTVEDCEVPLGLIGSIFGYHVAAMVDQLTDISKPSDGNRKVRKNIDLEHTRQASPDAKTIKLADLISNTRTIVQYDHHFARVYLREKERLLEVLTEGNEILFDMARTSLLQGILELKEKGLWGKPEVSGAEARHLSTFAAELRIKK